MPLQHLSYSSIASWNTCHRLWWFNYIRGIKSPASPAMMYGTAVHLVIQGIFIGEPIDALMAVKKAVAKNLASGSAPIKADQMKDMSLDISEILNDPGVDSVIRGIKVNPESIETYVEFEIPGVPYPVVGYIDAIQTNGVPLDIKTSVFDWDDDRAAREIQPMFYLKALNTGNDEFDHLVFVKSSLIPRVYLIRTHYPGFAERVDKIVVDAWEGMKQWLDPNTPPPPCDFDRCACHKIPV